MSVIIKSVTTKKELNDFVYFANKMYKGNPYYIPTMAEDDKNVFNPKTNGALDFCQCDIFLAYKDDIVVGRVAAILNPVANEKWGRKSVRFGWLDFIDDIEVSKALLDTVVSWGKERGCDHIEGPFGFSDMDPEGMLVDGFDQLGTMITFYHHPYYKEHMEKLGYSKVIDWVEYKIDIPKEVPEKHIRVAKLIEEKYGLHVRHYNRRERKKYNIGMRMAHLVNEAYRDLYGTTPLNEKQMKQYIKFYFGLLNFEFVPIIVDKNEQIVGFGATMPSLSKALQKCNGKLFPFGWIYLLRAMYLCKTDTVDFLLIAAKDEYRGKGLPSLLFCDLIPRFNKHGFKYCEANPELETNASVQNLWNSVETSYSKRRRIYGKDI